MTRREIAYQIESEGIDPLEVSLSAVNAYRVAFYEKSGHTLSLGIIYFTPSFPLFFMLYHFNIISE